jgi:hypothetical protein
MKPFGGDRACFGNGFERDAEDLEPPMIEAGWRFRPELQEDCSEEKCNGQAQ